MGHLHLHLHLHPHRRYSCRYPSPHMIITLLFLYLSILPSIIITVTTVSVVQGQTARWGQSPFPPTHQYHSCHNLREPTLVLCFGGVLQGPVVAQPVNDVFLFDTTTLTNPIWTTPSPYGELPSGRFNAATYYDEVTNRLYVHGGDQDVSTGQTAPYTIDDGLWILHLDNMTWTNHQTQIIQTNQPNVRSLARAGHAMVLHENELWISGGYIEIMDPNISKSKIPLTDIWRLSLDTLTWTYHGQMGVGIFMHKWFKDTINREAFWNTQMETIPPALGSGSSPIFVIHGGATVYVKTSLIHPPQLSVFLYDPNPSPPPGAASNHNGWFEIPSPWFPRDFVIQTICCNVCFCTTAFDANVVWAVTTDQRVLYAPTPILYPKTSPSGAVMLRVDLSSWSFTSYSIPQQPEPGNWNTKVTMRKKLIYTTNGYSSIALRSSPSPSLPLILIFGRDPSPQDDAVDDVYIIFNTTANKWYEPSRIPQMTTPRWGHTATKIGDNVYIFGGHSNSVPTDSKNFISLNSMEIHNVVNMTWAETVVATGDVPTPRGQHFATLMPNGRDILIYGGYGMLNATKKNVSNEAEVKRLGYNDVYLYNTQTGVWTKQNVIGQPPARPSVPTEWNCEKTKAVLINDQIVHIHGSNPSDERSVPTLTDVSILNINTWTWTHFTTQNAPNVILTDYSINYAVGKIWIIGGRINFSRTRRAPLYTLDVTTWTWSSQIEPAGIPFPGRYGHDVQYITNGRYNVFIITGGQTDLAQAILVLDLNTITLRQIDVKAAGMYSLAPSVYASPQTTVLQYTASILTRDGRMIIYGGVQQASDAELTYRAPPVIRTAVLWTGFHTSLIDYSTGHNLFCLSLRSPCRSLAWALRHFSRASAGTWYYDMEYPVDYYVKPTVISESITVSWHAGILSTASIPISISNVINTPNIIPSLIAPTPTFTSPFIITTNTLPPSQTVYMSGLSFTQTSLRIHQSASTLMNCIMYTQSSHGIRIDSGSIVTIQSSIISSNGDAGVSLEGANVNIIDSYISHNNHGIAATSLSTLSITSTTIQHNYADVIGAGIWASTAIVDMNNVIINDNHVYYMGESESFDVGGAGVALTSSTVNITGATITNNMLHVTSQAQSLLTARGIISAGGGLLSVYSKMSISASHIINNTAERSYGGGCAITLSNVIMDGNEIRQNNAELSGGGVYTRGSFLTSTRTTYNGNIATQGDGGGLLLENTPCYLDGDGSQFTFNHAAGAGGAIWWWPQRPNVSISATDPTTNTASYGPLIATPASQLIYTNRSALLLKHTTGDLITPPLILTLIDTYQQVVTNDDTSIISALPSSHFQGTLFQPAIKGQYIMSGLASRAAPASQLPISFSVTTRYLTITSTSSEPAILMIRACVPGEYIDTTGSVSQCRKCDIGTISTTMSASRCDPCAQGTYQPDIGQTSCIECGVGMGQVATGAKTCVACEPGRYSNKNGTITCNPCQAGSFNPYVGRTSCIPCAPGTATNQTGQVECISCLAGHYTSTNGSVTCQPCQLGSYQTVKGQTSCEPCPQGSASATPAATKCTPCSAGSYQNQTGHSICSDCTSGTYQDRLGQTSCLPCPAGSASSTPASVQCTACSAGSYQHRTGRSTCLDCMSGTYQDRSGQTFCERCPAGSASATPAAVACTACPAGSYQNETGHSTCFDCMSGTYQDRAGQTFCAACLAGQTSYPRSSACVTCADQLVAVVPGSPQCTSCPALSIPSSDHTRCECSIGSYGRIMYDTINVIGNRTDNVTTRVASVDCFVCPQGASCNSVGVMESSLYPQRGWWRQNDSIDFYQCLTRDTCVGNGMADNGCAPYRTGPICALCVPGYHAISTSATCTSCPSRTTSIALTCLFMFLILCGLILIYYSLIRADRVYLSMIELKAELADHTNKIAQARTQEVWTGMNMDMANLTIKDLDQTREGEHQEHHRDHIEAMVNRMGVLTPEDRVPYTFTIAMKILLGFFQILTNVTFLSNLSFPATFVQFINIFSFVNLDSIPFQTVQCVAGLSFYDRMIVVTLVPPILFVALVIFYLAPNYYLAHRDMSDDEARHASYRRHRAQFWKLCAFTLFLVYPSICNHVLSMFACRKVAGVSYVQADFSLVCYSSEWNRYLPYAILMIIVYPVGVPLLLFLLLAKNRTQLETPPVRLSIGFLYEAYHSSVWFFEIIDLLQKVLLTSLLVFFPQQNQMIVAMCIVMLYTCIILIQQPYIRRSDDKLHLLSQCELFLIFLFSYITQHSPLETLAEKLISILLIILVILMTCTFLVYIIMSTRAAIRQRQRQTMRKSVSINIDDAMLDTNTENSRTSKFSHTTITARHMVSNIEMMGSYKAQHKSSLTKGSEPPTPHAKGLHRNSSGASSIPSPLFHGTSGTGTGPSTPSAVSPLPSPSLHSNFGFESPSTRHITLSRQQRIPSSPHVATYYNPYIHPPRHQREMADLNLLIAASAPPTPSQQTTHLPPVVAASPHPSAVHDQDVTSQDESLSWKVNPLAKDEEDQAPVGLYSSTSHQTSQQSRHRSSPSPHLRSLAIQSSPSPSNVDRFARHRHELTATSSSLATLEVHGDGNQTEATCTAGNQSDATAEP